LDLLLELSCRVNRLLPRASQECRGSDTAYSDWEYETGRNVFLEHFGSGRLEGLRLLDAACGLGGKTAWYAEAGAASVTGLDFEPANVAQGTRFAAAHGVADRVRFVVGDAVRLPFGDGAFDALTATDAMEHFADPASALVELGRVVRPGGRVWLTFPPFHSPNGAHLYDYVTIPWCQDLLPRKVLYGTLRRAIEDAARTREGGDAAAWVETTYREHVEFFETGVNGMTIDRFHAIVRATPGLRLLHVAYQPPKFRFLAPLTRIPGVREYVTGLVVAELVRT